MSHSQICLKAQLVEGLLSDIGITDREVAGSNPDGVNNGTGSSLADAQIILQSFGTLPVSFFFYLYWFAHT